MSSLVLLALLYCEQLALEGAAFYVISCSDFLISTVQTPLHLSGRYVDECSFDLSTLRSRRRAMESLACENVSLLRYLCAAHLHIVALSGRKC